MLKNHLSEIVEYAKRHTLKETASKFNVTYSTMCNFFSDNNIKPSKFVSHTRMTKDEFRDFCKDKTKEEIADYLGITIKEAMAIMNSNCCKWKHTYKPVGVKGDRNEMIVFLSRKFTYGDIAKVFGITKQRVEQINKMYGDCDLL